MNDPEENEPPTWMPPPPVQTLIIERDAGGAFTVREGARFNSRLTFDEMLGLITSAMFSPDLKERYDRWMLTAEQWAGRENKLQEMRDQRKTEQSPA